MYRSLLTCGRYFAQAMISMYANAHFNCLAARKNYPCLQKENTLKRLTGLAFDFPLPDFGISVHNSLTFSKTILQCRSKAFTRASNLWLFRTFMRTWQSFVSEREPSANIPESTKKVEGKGSFDAFLLHNFTPTCELFFTLCERTESGPSSRFASLSGIISRDAIRKK